MVEKGFKNIIIRSVDNDELVLEIGYSFTLSEKYLKAIRIAFEIGKKHRFILFMIYYSNWKKKNFSVGFHDFTGCYSNPGFIIRQKSQLGRHRLSLKRLLLHFHFYQNCKLLFLILFLICQRSL